MSRTLTYQQLPQELKQFLADMERYGRSYPQHQPELELQQIVRPKPVRKDPLSGMFIALQQAHLV